MNESMPQAEFNVAEIRAAEKLLVRALEEKDPIGRVQMYTEDATFVAPGVPAVQGRDALLKRAKVASPVSSFVITPLETEGDGHLAYVYGHFSWVNGPTAANGDEKRSSMRFLIVWRKETDGRWRIARELLNSDAAPY